MRYLVFAVLCLYFQTAASQTGRLEIYQSYDDLWDDKYGEFIDIKLYSSDTLLYQFYNVSPLDTIIATGTYEVEVIRNNQVNQRIHEVRIAQDSVTVIDLAAYHRYKDLELERSDSLRIKSTMSAGFTISYSRHIPDPGAGPFSFVIGFKQVFAPVLLLGKYFGAGMDLGWGLEYGHIDQTNTLTPPGPNSLERYTYWSGTTGLFFRTALYDQKKSSSLGPHVDIGGYYNLPILFRHVYLHEKTKVLTRNIHKFSDVRAYARLGFKKGDRRFTAQLEYQLFDYVIHPYPELPRWTVRIGFHFLDR